MPFGVCIKCIIKSKYYWCNKCNAKRFQQNFQNWTSDNDDIDKFIQQTQLSANNKYDVLEWIPYDKFKNIEYIAKGGFGKVYRANWIDGCIRSWSNKKKNWHRDLSNMSVALKSLNNSKNVGLEFINEITSHHKLDNGSYHIIPFYGMTQDPETKNYMMVLRYAQDGSLRNYLDKNKSFSHNWYHKIHDLFRITEGLNTIHINKLIHGACITDMGLCKSANYNNNTQKSIYGVLPYVAPEILRGQNYTKASDIYSFGIIMYEVFSGLPPYYDVSHNENLAIKICNGLRPRFNIKVPQLIVNLIKRCLDANPSNRPTAEELWKILLQWFFELYYNQQTELTKQIKEADEINKNLSTSNSSPSIGLSYEIHTEAVYTSRLLYFNNLPEPKNSDDYYEQNDNIISKEFLVIDKIYSLYYKRREQNKQ